MRLEPATGVFLSLSTASQIIINRPCVLHNVILDPGSAVSDITLYDSATTSTNTTVRMHLHGIANGASISYNGSGSGVYFLNGCVAVLSGTGAQATVVFAAI